MNYYPHHIGDYAKDTRALSQGEHGAYRLLMDEAYTTENGIAADEVYAIACARSTAEKKNTDRVIEKFFVLIDGRYRQKRIDDEVKAYLDKSAKASASAMQRWSERNANAMRTHKKGICETDAPNNQEPIANSQQPVASSQSSALDKPKPREKQKRSANALAVYDRPPWLPEIWETYLQLRREKGASLAPTWLSASLKQLNGWRLQGYDIAAIVQNSVNNGYTGLFPPKANGSSGTRDAAAEWLRESNFLEGESERLPDA